MACIYKICGGCGFGYNPQAERHECAISKSYKRNAQLGPDERPILWTKKCEDGHVEVRYPGRHDGAMPGYYKSEGYEKTEFNSYQEHRAFCDANGLVNHKVEGIRDEALKN